MFSFLVSLAFSSLDGVEFSKDGETLISTPSSLKNYIIPQKCRIILGGDSVAYSSFSACINGIQTIKAEENSQLEQIYPYVFQGSSLVSADLSNCHKLLSLNYSVFRYSNNLKDVKLPTGMVTLLPGCLQGLNSLKSITIPDSVEELMGWTSKHSSVFTDCFNLKEIIFTPNSNLTFIGDDALRGTSITHLYIPRNTTQIHTAIFGLKITSFTVHEENQNFYFDGTALLSHDKKTVYFLKYNTGMVYNVPNYVESFARCACRRNNLIGIVFHKNVKNFEGFAFGETNLETFTFPEGIKSVAPRLFERCSKLHTVTLASSIRRIEWQAFCDCTELKNINIINEITFIGDLAFYQCQSLTDFNCPQKLEEMGAGVFYGCNELIFHKNGNTKFDIIDKILYSDGIIAQEYFGRGGSVSIPKECQTIKGYIFQDKDITKVTISSDVSLDIGEYAFYKTKITEIVLPSCLKSIGEFAFSSIPTLERVIIPESAKLSKLSKSVFSDCPLLSTLTLPLAITSIDDNAFANCEKLTTLSLESLTKLETIGNCAFTHIGITTATLPPTVSSIGEECFAYTKLETVTFNSCSLGILSIGAFSHCYSLSTVSLSDRITTISKFSFQSCSSLVEIEFPLQICDIREYAFDGCIQLKCFKLKPNCTLDKIYGLAFNNCPKLRDIIVQEDDGNFTAVDGVLMNKAKTKLILFLPASTTKIFVVPSTVEEIGSYAFSNCYNLVSVAIPEGRIRSVGFHSFENCKSLSLLYLPTNLNRFGKDAFIGCDKLKCGSVTYPHGKSIESAIESGIPRIAFETECPKENPISCNNFRLINRMWISTLFFLILQ